jgi:hypothetical protein
VRPKARMIAGSIEQRIQQSPRSEVDRLRDVLIA